MCSANAQCRSMIKKLTICHAKITMLIKNPHEDNKQGHMRSFMLKCKYEMIAKIESCCAFAASLNEAYWEFGIKNQYYCQWKKWLDHVPKNASSNIGKIYSGHLGILMPLNHSLLRYVFELHEQEMIMTTWILSRKASDLCHIFHSKLDHAKSLIVYRWLHLSIYLHMQHQMHSISCRR